MNVRHEPRTVAPPTRLSTWISRLFKDFETERLHEYWRHVCVALEINLAWTLRHTLKTEVGSLANLLSLSASRGECPYVTMRAFTFHRTFREQHAFSLIGSLS